MKTIIGLFDYAADAYAAQADLLKRGIEKERVSLLTSTANRDYTTEKVREEGSEAAEGAGIGAAAGAIAGGAAGLLASLGLLAIPGIGPLLAAGPIVAMLTGAGVGAATGGLIGGLVGLGIPEHEAEIYAEGVSRGGMLLTVDAPDAEADQIAGILSLHHAVDIDQRAGEWVAAGWQRKYSGAERAAGSVDARSRGLDRGVANADLAGIRRTSSARIYNPR